MKRVLGRRFGDWDDAYKRAAALIVRIGRNDDHRTGEPLFVPLHRIEGAPVNLPLFHYHFSSLKSVSETRSQRAISVFCSADCAASADDSSNARCTSAQKVFSSSSLSASSMTCALGFPSFVARWESTSMASSFMRTLVAMFDIAKSYHSRLLRSFLFLAAALSACRS